MIEPTPYVSRDEISRIITPGELIFGITGRSPDYYRGIGLFCPNVKGGTIFVSWYDDDENKYQRAINDRYVTSAKFMEYLMEHYPDHFEWFLFHPEWL